jgi:hypothetical protein
VLAPDGKTVRGSWTKAGKASALFGVFEHRHRLVLEQGERGPATCAD